VEETLASIGLTGAFLEIPWNPPANVSHEIRATHEVCALLLRFEVRCVAYFQKRILPKTLWWTNRSRFSNAIIPFVKDAVHDIADFCVLTRNLLLPIYKTIKAKIPIRLLDRRLLQQTACPLLFADDTGFRPAEAENVFERPSIVSKWIGHRVAHRLTLVLLFHERTPTGIRLNPSILPHLPPDSSLFSPVFLPRKAPPEPFYRILTFWTGFSLSMPEKRTRGVKNSRKRAL
jgi:hypothetical protein